MLSIMFKKRNLIIGGIILFIFVLIAVLPTASIYLSGARSTTNKDLRFFYIKEPISLSNLATQLEEQGLIDNTAAFISVGSYKGLDSASIAQGKYAIEPYTSYRTLLNGFTLNSNGNGNAEVAVDVTFNNCVDLKDLAEKVSACINIDKNKLETLLADPKTAEEFGFTAQQFPAMFLPNTYEMYYDTDEAAFLNRMAQEFKNYWTDSRKSQMKNIGLESPSQVVTLASIVYSEQSIVSEEWPIIAGLYLNRIHDGMRLQSDPTFKFCWGDKLKGVQRLLNIHREIDCEYNTYKIKGLPPGPICLPSTAVVDAVLNRAKHGYVYMCAKADYSHRHNFAVSGEEHMRNAKVFQRWLAGELKKKGK